MNTKEMVTSIVIAMVVMTMFASSAMAITVDGIAGAGEWAPSDKLVDDTDATTKGANSGYNISSMWAHYEGGKMYFRLDVYGTPGDMWGIVDSLDVSFEEYYEIHIDSDTNSAWSANDYNLVYNDGVAKLLKWNGVAPTPARYGDDTGETVHAAHNAIIEFEMPVNAHGYIDPSHYCIAGWADNDPDGLGEDSTPIECRTDDPPTAVCSFTPISCGYGTLSGTGSSDDGTTIEYAWDFGNDGSYDAYGENVGYSIIGTQDVRLMVTDDIGQTANFTLSATLTGDPTADAKANGLTTVQLPVGGMDVTFDGTGSSADSPATLDLSKCQWTIPGETCPTGLGPHMFFMDLDHTITATLKVEDDYGCEDTDTVSILPPPGEDVPLLTLPGLLALIGMMCIVGAGRIITRGRRS